VATPQEALIIISEKKGVSADAVIEQVIQGGPM
jgi:hypothetical protein